MQLHRIVWTVLIIASLVLAGCRQEPGAASGSNYFGDIPPANLVTITPPGAEIGVQPNTSFGQQEACRPPYFSSEDTRPQYQLDAAVSLKNHQVSVREKIVFSNSSTDLIEHLMLVVEPSRSKNVFSLASLKLGTVSVENYSIKDGTLGFRLFSPLEPGCAMEIRIEFALALPEEEGLFGYTNEQLVLTNWFPFVPSYLSGQEWQIHPPARFGEHLVYPHADFEVTLELEKGISSEMIAAPAIAEVDGSKIVYRLPNARTFSLAVLPGHRHISRTIDQTEFHVYFKPDSAAAARSALGTMVDAVEVFEDLFGDYPFENLSTAQLSMFDGMEYDGIFFLGRDIYPTYDHTSRNIFTLLVAHETAHNWWFSQVANDQALEPWLDEALATYSELLFLEQTHPELINWWWEFRVLDSNPQGLVDVSIYDYFDYERYRLGVYLRGALFLQEVRDHIGDKAFLEFLEKYYLDGKGKIATADLFFSTLEKVSDQRIDLIRASYFKSWQ